MRLFWSFLDGSLARNFSRSKEHFPDLEVCCDWSPFLTAPFSRRSLGRIAWLAKRTSAWEANSLNVKCHFKLPMKSLYSIVLKPTWFKITYLEQQICIFFFWHHLVVETVLKRPRILDGSKLKLERFTPKQSPEVRRRKLHWLVTN